MTSDRNDDDRVGYRRPPRSTQFKKGRSGNPKGRPKGRRSALPFDAVLGQLVTIREGGVERRVTAAEAFLLQLTKQGLEGDGAAARLAMGAIEHARMTMPDVDRQVSEIVVLWVTPGSVTTALEPLRMAKKIDRFRETAHMMLEPWIVEAALARLGKRQLSVEQQKVVTAATRTPHKVHWPDKWAKEEMDFLSVEPSKKS